MPDEKVSNRIATVPNLISFLRLAAIPVFVWLVLGADDVGSATLLFVIVAGTDWVDGYLARRLNQVSKLGKTLDPVADRLMIASAVIVGLIADIIPPAIGITLIVREVYMALVTIAVLARRGRTLEVRWLGKAATLLVYSAVGLFYMAAVPFLDRLTLPLAWIGSVVGLVLYWVVAIQYTGDARKAMVELESTATLEES